MEQLTKRVILTKLPAGLLFGILFFIGCSDSDSLNENGDDVTSTIIHGELGDLEDIGELLDSTGESWGYTKINVIAENGSVVGQSNNGNPAKAAFLWDAATEEMSYLGMHSDDAYDDYYSLTEETSSDDEYFLYSEAVGNSSVGDVIGNSTTGTNWPNETKKRAFYWNNGEFTDLSPGYYEKSGETYSYYVVKEFSEAICINDDYVLVNLDDKTGRHAYYWDKSSFISIDVGEEEEDEEEDDDEEDEEDEPPYTVSVIVPDYGILGNAVIDSSEAVAINDNNQAIMNSGDTVVFHDLDTDAVEYLNHLPNANSTVAAAVNDHGHVAGTSGSEAFLWDSGVMYPCGDLGGGESVSTGLNNNDQVVGYSLNSDDVTHAFIWELDNGQGVITDLGTLGGANSWAAAINDNGMIIGYSETGTTYSEGSQDVDIYHACVWYNDEIYDFGVITDFYENSDVTNYPFSECIAINENNRIAGNSYTINDHSRGFILDPIIP